MRRRSTVVLTTLLLLVGGMLAGLPGAAAAQTPQGAAPRVNGPVVFVANHDIWYRDGQGAYHQVTRGLTGPNWDLEVSPDGRRVAFSIASTSGLWVVNLNGTGLRNVLGGYREVSGNSGYDPSWDPSGRRLVFTAFSAETGNHELFTVGVDQPSSLERLTQWGVGSEAVPVWSPVPGSNEIAYIPCCTGRIKTIDALTRQERFVTAEDDPPAWNIDWSPDGSRLAVEANSDGRLYTVGSDGTGWTYLDPQYSRALKNPSWSPDGSLLAVEGLDEDGVTGVLLVDPATGVPGGVTSLTSGWGGTEFAPSWGPLCEVQCIGTELTAKAKRKAELQVSGVLVPGVVGARVEVTLVRAMKRGWRAIAVKRVRTKQGGRYRTSMVRPGKGRCGVLVEFGGTPSHMPSYTAIRAFRC